MYSFLALKNLSLRDRPDMLCPSSPISSKENREYTSLFCTSSTPTHLSILSRDFRVRGGLA